MTQLIEVAKTFEREREDDPQPNEVNVERTSGLTASTKVRQCL